MEGFEEIVELFRAELSERLSRVEAELLRGGEDIELLYREFHTIKGTAQMVGFENYSKAAHMVEDVLKPLWKEGRRIDPSMIPSLLKALDVFRRKMEEDLTEEDLEELGSILKGENREEKRESLRIEITSGVDERTLERAVDLADELLFLVRGKREREVAERLASTLHELYWQASTVLLEDVLRGFERLVYEEANREGKKVRLEMRVEGVRVKKDVASPLRDSLVHVVKNAVVHGIETPQERLEAGKSEEGLVRIEGRMEGRWVVVEVSDDGRGISRQKLEEKLREMGLEYEGDVLQVIFEPFFSTKENADLGGGRGVGLSSVKRFVEEIGGRVEVETEEGKGTTFRLIVPGGRVWERVLVLRDGYLFAVRISSVERVILKDGMKVVLKDGRELPFRERVFEGELLVLENPYPSLGVPFWVAYSGLPVPVIEPSKKG